MLFNFVCFNSLHNFKEYYLFIIHKCSQLYFYLILHIILYYVKIWVLLKNIKLINSLKYVELINHLNINHDLMLINLNLSFLYT